MIYGIRINNREGEVSNTKYEGEGEACGLARENFAGLKPRLHPGWSMSFYCASETRGAMTLERYIAE